MNRIRVFLADDHPEVLEKLASLLGREFDIVGTATDGQEAVDGVRRLRPKVLVIDITMPIMSGIDVVEKLKKLGAMPATVFLTLHSDPDFLRAGLAAGACGYVLKARMVTDLVSSIHEAIAGRIFISPFAALRK